LSNNKLNFIVSGAKKFWKLDLSKCEVSNPLLELKYKEDLNNCFTRIKYFGNTRRTSQDLKNDSDYIDKKYKKYTKIFAERLNLIHDKNYSHFFWSKALSIGFLRQLNILYDHFKIYERYFDEEKHYVNILSRKDFLVPIDYEESRNIISDDSIGSEQVFSIYINLFYKANIDKKISHQWDIRKSKKFKIDHLNLILLKIKRFLLSKKKTLVVTGILGSYFSKQKKKKLIKINKGKIDEIFMYPKITKNDYINHKMRKKISQKQDEFDSFDKFYFEAQKSLFPKFFLENFHKYERYISKKLESYNELKFIISENWIIEPINSLALALAKENHGIIHINNEHNCFSHIYQGRYLEYIINLSDDFYNIGWESNNSKVIKSSSLYNFSIKKKKHKYEILFVSAPIQYKLKYYSFFEVYSQENAIFTIDFNNQFFESLDDNLLKKIFYKKYPINYYIEKEKFYTKSFKKVNLSLSASKFNALNLMSKSKLVIIDYVSTAYLESFISNIPTVVFFNKSSSKLDKRYHDFFDVLIDSGIFQTNPVDASKLIREIYKDPLNWWNSFKIKKSRELFIKKNIGRPKIFFDQISKITSENH